ncbi:MAG: hypothetical protein QM784_37045 [Polyangiaceae bacterium]
MENPTVGTTVMGKHAVSDTSVIIRDAFVYTCEGGSRVADVALSGDRIVEVGKVTRQAARVIDARGLALAPGFVDLHNHTDFYLGNLYGNHPERVELATPLRMAHNYVAQGVTTICTGNCGIGFSDIATWEGIFAGGGFGTNVCHLVPYESLLAVSVASQSADCSSDRLKRLATQMDAGAVGFSTSLGSPAQSHAARDEILGYCAVLQNNGGIYVMHVRGESGRDVLDSIDEGIDIAVRSEVHVHLSQWRVLRPYPKHRTADMMDRLLRAQGRGTQISASQNPYGSVAARLDWEYVRQLLAGTERPLGEDEAISQVTFERVVCDIAVQDVLVVQYEAKPEYQGRNLAQIAQDSRSTPAAILEELYRASSPPYLVVEMMDQRSLLELMHELILTSSNGEVTHPNERCVHPRSYGTFPRRLSMCSGSFEDAIESMTVRPAELLGLVGRGRIRRGYFADSRFVGPAACFRQHGLRR